MAKAAKMIKVEQIGSAIRRHHSQRATLIGMKLNKIGRVSELEDTPSVRGMISGDHALYSATTSASPPTRRDCKVDTLMLRRAATERGES